MEDAKVYADPSEVDAEEGVVIVRGPNALAIKLTPEAAEETSNRLLDGALKARGQLYFDEKTR